MKKATNYTSGQAGEVGAAPRTRGISLRNLRTFSSLKNPVYRLYYAGMTGQWASMNMQLMTNSLLMYRLTDSAALLGLMSLANGLPVLFLSLVGGVIADRVQKKYVLLAGLTSSAMVSLGIALALSLGYLSRDNPGSWVILLISSALQGSIMGCMMPSRQSIISEIVSEEQLTNALALNNLGMNSLRLLAPAATGFLIYAFDFKAVYFTMTAMYLMSVGFMSFVPATRKVVVRSSGALRDMAEGFQYLRRESTLLLILMFTLFGVVLSMPYMRLLPIFTDDILGVGERGLGILMSVSGAGAIVGSLTIASLRDRRRGLMLVGSSFVLASALILFAFSRSWGLSLVAIVFVGLGQTGRMTLGNSLLQSNAAPEYRGRVMSFYMMEQGLTSISTFFAGLLAEAMGAPWAVGGFAMVLIVTSFLMLVLVPRLRRLR